MNKAIIGKKVGMTQIFNADGKVIPCTVIEAGPCVVTQLKTEEKDGYNAVQFGFEDVKEARLNKPQKGHLKKAGDSLKKYLKEFRFEDCTPFQLGDVVKADMFVTGDYVDVTGTSKGKGYAGVIKRFNASRLKETHGTGPVHRHAGSMGACSDPSKIMKGKMMPGHMGAEQVTVQNLDVVKVDAEPDRRLRRGSGEGGIVVLKNTVKATRLPRARRHQQARRRLPQESKGRRSKSCLQ
ncbi:MAG: 50S ribosomal protein L3 [Butyricicoccus sp.]